MMDIFLMSQMNSTQHLRPIGQGAVPILGPVTEVSASSGLDARTDSHNFGNGSSNPQSSEQHHAKKAIKSDTIAGPAPTFQVSILEMETHLKEAIARINATQAFSDPITADASRQLEAAETQVSDKAHVSDAVPIASKTHISDDASIADKPHVSGEAPITGKVHFADKAHIPDEAPITDAAASVAASVAVTVEKVDAPHTPPKAPEIYTADAETIAPAVPDATVTPPEQEA